MSYQTQRYMKVMSGIIDQVGTNNPVVTELANGIGTITYVRTDVGEFQAQSAGLFTEGRTQILMGCSSGFVYLYPSNANTIYISTTNTSNTPQDGTLSKVTIEIRVYESDTVSII